MSIWSKRTDTGPNRNNLFSIRQIRERYQNILVSFPTRYRKVCLFIFDITRQPLPEQINSPLKTKLLHRVPQPSTRARSKLGKMPTRTGNLHTVFRLCGYTFPVGLATAITLLETESFFSFLILDSRRDSYFKFFNLLLLIISLAILS